MVVISSSPPDANPESGVDYSNFSSDLNVPTSMIGSSKVLYYTLEDYETDRIQVFNLNPEIQKYYINIYLILNSSTQYTRPFTNIVDNPKFKSASIPGSISPIIPSDPKPGDVFFDMLENQLKVFNPISLVWEKLKYNVVVEQGFPDSPYLNMLLYNTMDNTLYIYNGTIWKKVNTVNDGVPLYNKPGIGIYGDTDARNSLVDTVKQMLGYPQVAVELTDSQINRTITNALKVLRQKSSDVAYTRAYVPFEAHPGRQVYYLNDPAAGTDKIVDVLSIIRSNWMNISGLDMYTQQLFMNNFIAPVFNGSSGGDLLGLWEWYNFSDDVTKLLAEEISFTFDETSRVLKTFKRHYRQHLLILEAIIERPEQALITDRFTGLWIQDYAVAECKGILGQVRSKYSTLPGANGGLALNGNELIAQSTAELEALYAQLDDFSFSNFANWGNCSIFLG